MFRNSISLFAAFFLTFSAFAATPTLHDIKPFTGSELSAIKRRYPQVKHNPELFTAQEFATIATHGLGTIVADLILHPAIKLEGAAELIEFAQKVSESGLDFRSQLEPRLKRYIKEKMPPFIAVDEAIAKESQSQWRNSKVAEAKDKNRPFVAWVNQSRLSELDKQKMIRVYAVCIASYENAADRAMLEPKICDPVDDYPEPRYNKCPSSVGRKLRITKTDRAKAYRSLMEEARRVASLHDLNDFERIMMARCIGERSLRFFVPSHHPIKSAFKEIARHHNTPDKAFFMRSGICSNFSAITYNAARELGLENQVHLVRKGAHVYVEFREGSNWYHTHPFNKRSVCDITRYKH